MNRLFETGPISVLPGSSAETALLARSAGVSLEQARAAIRRQAERPTPGPGARPTRPAPRRNAALAEVAASRQGAELGARFRHDPEALAASMGATVNYVDGDELAGSDRYRAVTGSTFRPTRTIAIAAGLPAFERRRVLAHELAHLLGVADDLEPFDAERACNSFATAFLAPTPTADDQDAAAWKAIQSRQQAAAEADARLRAAMRR